MTTSSKTQRPKRNTGALKALIFTSSLIATLAGTQLLNIQAALQPAAAIADQSSAVIDQRVAPVPVTIRSASNGQPVIVLGQIPQAVQPQFRAVARTRSSN